MIWLTPILMTSFAASGCVKVDTERILVRDLVPVIAGFESLNQSLAVGFSPRFGVSRVFSRRDIMLLGQRLGVPLSLEQVYPICVERSSTILTETQVIAAISAAIQKDGVTVEILDYTHSPIPPGKVEFPRSGAPVLAGPGRLDPVLWRGRVVDHLGMSVPIWARVQMSVKDSIVIAVKGLKPGVPINEEQVRLVLMKRPALFDYGPTSLEQVIGKVPQRAIPEGAPIDAKCLRDPVEVAAGDMVRATVSMGEAQIRFDGRAQTSGRKGDTVLVQNPASGRSFRARVVEKGVVTIDVQFNSHPLRADYRH